MGFALQFLGLYGLASNSSRADMAAALASHGPMLLPNCYQPPAHPFCRGEGNDAALDLTTLARIEARRVSDDPARVGPKPGRCGRRAEHRDTNATRCGGPKRARLPSIGAKWSRCSSCSPERTTPKPVTAGGGGA